MNDVKIFYPQNCEKESITYYTCGEVNFSTGHECILEKHIAHVVFKLFSAFVIH